MRNAVYGTVGIRGLDISCIIGVLENERIDEQVLHVDVLVEYDFAGAVLTDSVDDALDYRQLAAVVRGDLETQQYGLLESAATGVGRAIARAYPAVRRFEVEIRKPEAIAGRAVAFARVESTPGNYR